MSLSVGSVVETACAKINLYLHITGIRDNGYHELDSLFVFANFGDLVSFDENEVFSLEVSGPYSASVPSGDDNLILRAASAFAVASGQTKGAKISLVKNLPVASGIGGGSADAAAVLRGLNRLWKTGWTNAALAEIGLILGADIPAWVACRPVQVSGIGEILAASVLLPRIWIVLVNPGVSVSTPDVFGLFDEEADFSAAAPLVAVSSFEDFVAELKSRRNDLGKPAEHLVPAISDVLKALTGQAGCSFTRMSGSGATCFGLFQTATAAKAAKSHISRDYPHWWVESGELR
ncbi:MAG: 4-(cytidine 5'-diphospho)-2-C-methyl-D-erythritol kinase [Proteobacteria bacterium]|nr:4-(cytidine 5'-diphospho)-2-C-methyl-D-erythritol kinase [Pseudomonadota bacterium]